MRLRDKIDFDEYIGGKLCICQLSRVMGAGGSGVYYFYVSSYYWGMVHLTSRGWEAHIKKISDDQKRALINLIIENEAE